MELFKAVLIVCLVMMMAGLAIAADLPAGEAGPAVAGAAAGGAVAGSLRIGWAEADITPPRPVSLAGQFHVRISQRVLDPLTATVLLLESGGDGPSPTRAVMVSCDLISIRDEMRSAIIEQVRGLVPEIDPMSIIINGTHTHTAPHTNNREPLPDGVMSSAEYVAFAAQRIAEAIAAAWRSRAPGGTAFGLGHAVVGHNRLMSYSAGNSRMYGRTNDPAFTHVEGFEDHSLHILLTYDKESQLTGVVLNVACPSQVSEHLREVSADFWHETRQELRQRFGAALHVLPQASAAGDQSPRTGRNTRPEERMQRLSGRNRRQEIAVRIADAVAKVKPLAEKELDWNPVLKRHSEVVDLPRRRISQQDADEARAAAAAVRLELEALEGKADADPQVLSRTQSMLRRHELVVSRYALQQEQPNVPVALHVVRLGDVAFATNPFELYLDYGIRIQARSKATQTFIVQLTGGGSYLPTERSIAGGAYGSAPASTQVGPEGGAKLVEWTLETIEALFQQ